MKRKRTSVCCDSELAHSGASAVDLSRRAQRSRSVVLQLAEPLRRRLSAEDASLLHRAATIFIYLDLLGVARKRHKVTPLLHTALGVAN